MDSDKRTLIKEVAKRLISKKGAKLTTLAEIAKAVGISKGTLFYYYPSKDEILFEVLDDCFAQYTSMFFSFLKEVKNVPSVAPSQVFRLLLELFACDQPLASLNLLLLHEALSRNQNLLERFRQKYEEWRELIAIGLGELYYPRPELGNNGFTLASVILALIDGFSIQYLIDEGRVQPERIGQVLELAVRGVIEEGNGMGS
ncbi:MAG: TetR/AcrR family transcriptional regulator [Clostridia bacterium]|nr:TetR/AcrR family transcriptional regulator [Clostridia bacterium]